MKLIPKSGPPPDYAQWCTATEDWNPSWGALQDDRPMRRLVVQALVAEQQGLCAYCNERISLPAVPTAQPGTSPWDAATTRGSAYSR